MPFIDSSATVFRTQFLREGIFIIMAIRGFHWQELIWKLMLSEFRPAKGNFCQRLGKNTKADTIKINNGTKKVGSVFFPEVYHIV